MTREEKTTEIKMPAETIRDVVALVALIPLVHAARRTYRLDEAVASELAGDAYLIADAMLRARSKQTSPVKP
jgi:hypothetical protein